MDMDLDNNRLLEYSHLLKTQLSTFPGSYDDMMINYRELLTYIKSAVTRNHSEKSINSILDYVSVSKNVS